MVVRVSWPNLATNVGTGGGTDSSSPSPKSGRYPGSGVRVGVEK